MWQGVDKRRFPRAEYPCEVTVIKKGQKEEFSTQTENIGMGGICVILKKALVRFYLVELVLYLKDGQPPIKCDGRIVWVVKSKEQFDTGIEFINIKERDVARIQEVIEECLKANPSSSENH
jgi:c-di-GMP-binding flagellar brake protein YcgR